MGEAPGTSSARGGRSMNCILETKRTLTTESLTVFIQQEMGLLSSQSGCANRVYMFIYLPLRSLWTLFKREGKKVQEGNSLPLGKTHTHTTSHAGPASSVSRSKCLLPSVVCH